MSIQKSGPDINRLWSPINGYNNDSVTVWLLKNLTLVDTKFKYLNLNCMVKEHFIKQVGLFPEMKSTKRFYNILLQKDSSLRWRSEGPQIYPKHPLTAQPSAPGFYHFLYPTSFQEVWILTYFRGYQEDEQISKYLCDPFPSAESGLLKHSYMNNQDLMIGDRERPWFGSAGEADSLQVVSGSRSNQKGWWRGQESTSHTKKPWYQDQT